MTGIFIKKNLKKNWHYDVLISLIIMSSFATGVYYSNAAFKDQISENNKVIAADGKTVLNPREESIMSSLMEQTVGNCYYDLYQQNESQPTTGNVCNNAIMFFQQICKKIDLDSCDNDYMHQYVKRMEG